MGRDPLVPSGTMPEPEDGDHRSVLEPDDPVTAEVEARGAFHQGLQLRLRHFEGIGDIAGELAVRPDHVEDLLFDFGVRFLGHHRSVEDVRDFGDRGGRVDVKGGVERVVCLLRGRGRTGLPLRLHELHLLEEPEGVGAGPPELLLDLPGRLPTGGDFLEHLALDLRVDRAENRNQFGDLAHNLDAIQRNPRARYPVWPLSALFRWLKEFPRRGGRHRNDLHFRSMDLSVPLHDFSSPSRAETFKRNPDVRGSGRMKVKELRPESKVDVIELTIRQKGDARDFSSRSGSTGKVADAKAVDDEGTEVSVSLWNDEIERVQANDRIRITNGWVREWRGNMQVSAGRYGKLEVLR